jgi:hypothetical protein
VASAEAGEPGQLRRGSAETETAARSARIGDVGCGGSRVSATRFSAVHDGAVGKCQPYGDSWPPVVAGCYLRRFLIDFTQSSKSSMHFQRSAGPGNGVPSAAA